MIEETIALLHPPFAAAKFDPGRKRLNRFWHIALSVSAPKEGKPKVTVGRVYAISTILAVIIAVPAVAVTLLMHYVVKAEIFMTLTAGLITLFIAMGFGYKLAKKFARIPPPSG